MAFTAKDVAKLREQTGAGMMDCKKALTATDGDMKKAAEYLREQGVNIAAKKASRIASEGAVFPMVAKDGKTGAMVEVNCESDFVAKADTFVALCSQIGEIVCANDVKSVDELLATKCSDGTVLDLINNATAKIGEKISLRRFVKVSTQQGLVEAYDHMGGKIGVLVEVATNKDLNGNETFKTMCHDIAMHIAAFSPKYVYDSEVPAAETEHEKEILTAQALNEGKPAAVVEKMIGGRIKKFFKEICLIDQDFAKDSSKTVRQLVDETAKALGAEIKIVRFERFLMGEGLEKKNENFAEEIAKLQK
ncbi:MAG: elongation factor Ts [Clostridia bacterium]|nr:elongation factor Ts [Clostridia bacterium]